ncbi:MAG: NAD-dependent epimerase/dehydratase family protein [Sandaracinaceae bacterium]|nr:NAD-dependent epimerase/dehydratase family protein [Sandaracinaceae bacterium]
MNVFVAGAGYVGLELCRQLAQAGHRAWAARRHPPALPEGVTPWPCDLTDPELVVPEGVTHLAFTASPDSSDPASYERTYVTALERTLAAFDRASAKGGTTLERVLLVSSTSVFASPPPTPTSASPVSPSDDDVITVDETSPVRTDGTAAHIVAGESRVLSRGGVVLRLAGIYGPTRTRMIRMVKDGTARISPDRPIGNRIHRDDCAGAIAHLLAHPSPEPIYVGVDHAPVELAEVYRFLAEALGLPPPATSDEPDARARDAAIRGGTARKRCVHTKLLASGYTFRFPTYREGYAPLLRSPE